MDLTLCAGCEEKSGFLPLFEVALLTVVALVTARGTRRNRLLLLRLPREVSEADETESLELPLAA